MNENRRGETIRLRPAGTTASQRHVRPTGILRRSRLLLAIALGAVMAACVLLILAVTGPSAKPVAARNLAPSTVVPTVTTLGKGSNFVPSIDLTRSQVESSFREIDGSHTAFKAVTKLHGVPRVLGSDNSLYTIVEINGYPSVTDVQVVSVLETTSKTTLQNQVLYDSLTCGAFGGQSAQNWCTSRILNTNSHGLVTATKAADFGAVRITVKTYQAAKSSSPPIVSINVSAI